VLRAKRRSQLIAAASILAALYAILGFIPVSRLIGIGGFITLREAISPVAGMVLGPVAGGLSIVIGVLLDIALGKPVIFFGLDFMIDMAAAVVAGLAFTRRRVLAVLFPITVLVVFAAGPSSPVSVTVWGIPFLWMHVLSILVLGTALFLEKRKTINLLGPAFVGSVVFAATMCGHAVGGTLTEFFYLSSGEFFGNATSGAYWSAIFVVYPLERVFLTVVGTVVALPVLRALQSRQNLITGSE
jgi:hypothetical protein